MIFELLKLNVDITDDDFDSIYPEWIKTLAQKHWTPVSVAKIASEFLVDKPGAKVLDIGSGAGKFCMIGAVNTKGYFTGIEQRPWLVKASQELSSSYQIRNTEFIQANITSVKFNDYDSFYFFNSFHENVDLSNRIDETVRLGVMLYDLYSMYIVEQFTSLRPGARLVTYCSPLNIVPRNFRLVDSLRCDNLKFWEKIA